MTVKPFVRSISGTVVLNECMAQPTVKSLRPLLLSVPLEIPTDLPVGAWTSRPNLLVIIEASTGETGVGEVWVNFPTWGCEDRIAVLNNYLAPLVLGEVLDDPRRIHKKLWDGTRLLASRWAAPGPVSHAIAGVDIAIWDLVSKQKGLPLRDFIAGRPCGSAVEAYASGIGPAPPAPLVEAAISEGHSRFKLRLVSGPVKDAIMLHEGRVAAGDRSLMADPGESYSFPRLASIADEIIGADLLWMEEPFPVLEIDQYRQYDTAGWGPDLALGESSYGAPDFRKLLEDMHPTFVQPDVTKTAGITQSLEIADVIREFGCALCPHMLGGPVGLMASANFLAATDGFLQEVDADPVATHEPILGSRPIIENGQLILSAKPGLGVEISEDDLREWIVPC